MDNQTQKIMEEHGKKLAVITNQLDNFSKSFNDFIEVNKKEHEDIITAQKHTNGDVTNLKLWKARLIAAGAVLYFFIMTIFPVLIYYFMQTSKYEIKEELKNDISTAIEQNNKLQFEEYNTVDN